MKARTIKNFKILVRFPDNSGLGLASNKIMDSVANPIYDYIDEIENDEMAIRQEAEDNK